jgi:hypothetical protein
VTLPSHTDELIRAPGWGAGSARDSGPSALVGRAPGTQQTPRRGVKYVGAGIEADRLSDVFKAGSQQECRSGTQDARTQGQQPASGYGVRLSVLVENSTFSSPPEDFPLFHLSLDDAMGKPNSPPSPIPADFRRSLKLGIRNFLRNVTKFQLLIW